MCGPRLVGPGRRGRGCLGPPPPSSARMSSVSAGSDLSAHHTIHSAASRGIFKITNIQKMGHHSTAGMLPRNGAIEATHPAGLRGRHRVERGHPPELVEARVDLVAAELADAIGAEALDAERSKH